MVRPLTAGTSRGTRRGDFVVAIVIIPPDGGWGWVVVMVSFVSNFVMDGSVYTFGIFLNDIGQGLNVFPTQVALASSVMVAVMFLAGPVVCGLTNKYGFRLVGFLGSLLSASAYAGCTFVRNFYAFVVVYGLVGGFAGTMMFVPSVVVVGLYFEQWRALATSIALCGSSVGCIVLPIVFNKVLADYKWETKFYLLAGGYVLCALLVLAYVPLTPQKVLKTREEDRSYTYPLHSTLPSTGASSLFSYRDLSIGTGFTFFNAGSEHSFTMSRMPSLFRSEFMSYYDSDDDEDLSYCKRTWCYKKCCKKSEPHRPMYRDDIFYGGSVRTLPEYKRTQQSLPRGAPATPKKPMVSYHMSVTRVASLTDLEEEQKCCVCCPQAFVRTLAIMLDCKLLANKAFLWFLLSNFSFAAGLYAPYIYITERAREKKLNPEVASILISISGISSLFGRVSCGFIASAPKVNPAILTYLCLFLCGAATEAFVFTSGDNMYYGYMGILGFCAAVPLVIRSILIVRLVGLEKLNNAFGLTLLFQGIATLMGVPVAGYLVEVFNTYDAAFIYAGSFHILAGLFLLPTHCYMKT